MSPEWGEWKGGTCYYPTKDLPTYRITCSVKGPFPAMVRTRKSPLYAREDGTYPPAPEGLVPGREILSPRHRKGKTRRWIRLYGMTSLGTLDEAIVWIVAHEAFHFLRRTRQITGKNTEIDADRYADAALLHYQQGWPLEWMREWERFHAPAYIHERKFYEDPPYQEE